MSLMSPALVGGFFTTSATWEALYPNVINLNQVIILFPLSNEEILNHCRLKKKMHKLKVENYILFGELSKNLSQGYSLSALRDCSEEIRKKSGYIEVDNKGVRQSECCMEEYNSDSMLETVSLTCFYCYNHTQWLAWRTLPSAWL